MRFSSLRAHLVGLFASFCNPFSFQKRPKPVWPKSILQSILVLFGNGLLPIPFPLHFEPGCHSAILFSYKPSVICLARMPIRAPLGRLTCVLLVSFLYLLQTLSLSTQILLWPPLISISSSSATVFPFSFPLCPLSSLSCPDLPVRTIQGNLFSYLSILIFFFALDLVLFHALFLRFGDRLILDYSS